jgi:hypothetical protein
MSWLFRWLFFQTKSDMFMVRSEAEPGRALGENELPSMMFDQHELV